MDGPTPSKKVWAYDREPYLRRLPVTVLEVGVEADRAFAVLDDTILYPEGGGQPSDRGRLGDVPVLDVRRADAEIRHYLDAPVETGTSTLVLDWQRRFDHMQQHTAQHLLTAVAASRFGWNTTSFHLGARRCDIELDAAPPSPAELVALEDAVMEVARSGRAVTSRRVSPSEYEKGEVRSRGLPAEHHGDVRVVQIDGVDACACGGTHVHSTSEIETVKLLGAEPMRGGSRLYWVAGERARGLLAEHEARTAELKGLLDASAEDLGGAAAAMVQRLQGADRRIRFLEGRLAAEAARRLAQRPDVVLEDHFEDTDGRFLQEVGRRLAKLGGGHVALLTASGPGGDSFLLVAAEGCEVDLPTTGPKVAEILDGRGGGSGSLFQGKAGSLERRIEAVDLLRSEVCP